MTVSVVLAIAGVVALFLSIWGGGIKAKEIEIPIAPLKARWIVGIIGLFFIGISVWLSVPTSLTQIAVNISKATVSRSQVDEWNVGETTEANVYDCLDKSDKVPTPSISFVKGDTIPKGVLLATGFWIDGGAHWNQLPVKPVCVYNDWGLFESTDQFKAVSPGGYRRIIP